jgi:hypothetical protein
MVALPLSRVVSGTEQNYSTCPFLPWIKWGLITQKPEMDCYQTATSCQFGKMCVSRRNSCDVSGIPLEDKAWVICMYYYRWLHMPFSFSLLFSFCEEWHQNKSSEQVMEGEWEMTSDGREWKKKKFCAPLSGIRGRWWWWWHTPFSQAQLT